MENKKGLIISLIVIILIVIAAVVFNFISIKKAKDYTKERENWLSNYPIEFQEYLRLQTYTREEYGYEFGGNFAEIEQPDYKSNCKYTGQVEKIEKNNYTIETKCSISDEPEIVGGAIDSTVNGKYTMHYDTFNHENDYYYNGDYFISIVYPTVAYTSDITVYDKDNNKIFDSEVYSEYLKPHVYNNKLYLMSFNHDSQMYRITIFDFNTKEVKESKEFKMEDK